MNLMQLPDAKRQVSEEKRGQRTKHNRFQEDIRKLSPFEDEPQEMTIDGWIPVINSFHSNVPDDKH